MFSTLFKYATVFDGMFQAVHQYEDYFSIFFFMWSILTVVNTSTLNSGEYENFPNIKFTNFTFPNLLFEVIGFAFN